MIVVASIREWDGVRILGAFDCKEKAFQLCTAAGFDTDDEAFNLDIIEMNKVSEAHSLFIDSDERVKNFIKVHIYPEDMTLNSEDSENMNI